MENLDNLRHKATFMLTTLKEHPTMEGILQVPVNFAGYASLVSTASELMKLCTVLMSSEEPHLSPLLGNTKIDLPGIMELASQLMPLQEAEFLDVVRESLVPENEDWEFILATVTLAPPT